MCPNCSYFLLHSSYHRCQISLLCWWHHLYICVDPRKPDETGRAVSILYNCISEIKNWMMTKQNSLLLPTHDLWILSDISITISNTVSRPSPSIWLHIFKKMPSVLINADIHVLWFHVLIYMYRPFVHLYVYTFKPKTMSWLCILCTRTVNISCIYTFVHSVEYKNVLIWTSWETSTLYWKRYPE